MRGRVDAGDGGPGSGGTVGLFFPFAVRSAAGFLRILPPALRTSRDPCGGARGLVVWGACSSLGNARGGRERRAQDSGGGELRQARVGLDLPHMQNGVRVAPGPAVTLQV